MKNIIIIVVILFCCSCPSTNKTEVKDTLKVTDSVGMEKISGSENIIYDVNIEKLLPLLGTNIENIPIIECFTMTPVIVEDEGISWKVFDYSNNNSIAFRIECNWQNELLVHRITIYSNQIKYGELLYTGQTVGNIKHMLDNKIPTVPDGYLFVTLKNEPSIRVQLDISDISINTPLYYGGIDNITDVPDSLRIEAIVLLDDV